MNKTNDVFQVLVLEENSTKTGHVSALTSGDWGVFNASTDVAFDGTSAVNYPNEFYFAKMQSNGKLMKSGAFYISLKGIWELTQSAATAATAQVLTLGSLGDVEKDKVYSIKFEFRGNSEIYTRFGYNQASKFFVADTSCEPNSPATELLAQLYEAIANDPDHFLDVEITGALGVTKYDTATQKVGVLTGAQVSELAALRAGTWTNEALVVTVNRLSEFYSFCNINPKYFKNREVVAIPSLGDAACAWGTWTETTPPVYATNLGYDVRELEYQAFGWNENIKGVYRQSNLHGLPLGDFSYQVADASLLSGFNIAAIQYDFKSPSGWKEYTNSISTLLVFPANGNDVGAHMTALATASGITLRTGV